MIIDRLENADRYTALHPGFAAAFAWLRSGAGQRLAEGRHALDGERLWVNVMTAPGRSRDAAPLEVHRQYIDIQFIAAGEDTMGWEATMRCQQPLDAFSVADDIGFFSDAPACWVTLTEGMFTIFFPEDAHAPMVGEGIIRKTVVKVAMEW